MHDIVLLGPQAVQPNVDQALEELNVTGPVCVVTAGWQERAGELAALEAHLRRNVVDLMLYQRADLVWEQDFKLFQAHRQRQNRLRELQRIYRIRLSYQLEAARHLMRSEGDSRLLEPERAAAIEAVRQLDRHHLQRLAEENAAFDREWRSGERTLVRQHRREMAQIVADSEAVLVAGGHVAVLLTRLRLFDFAAMLEDKPIIAWSGGAMALSEKLVLFHDSPPQGAGDAEVLEHGLGICKGIVPLPHAGRRLRLNDSLRVSLLARRFSPSLCIAMDPGSFLRHNGRRWCADPGTRLLTEDGRVSEAPIPA